MVKLTPNNQVEEYNGPPATSYGADFDAEARVTHELTLNLGASYIHDRFTAEHSDRAVERAQPSFPGRQRCFLGLRAEDHRLPHTPD